MVMCTVQVCCWRCYLLLECPLTLPADFQDLIIIVLVYVVPEIPS